MTQSLDISTVIARAEAQGATVGVSVVAPDGAAFHHRGDRRFVAASTVKIAILIELFRQAEAGTVSLADRHVLTAADKASGSGVLGQVDDGLAPTLRDLAFLMMSISDNSATNILIDLVGLERVNATMRALGMRESTLGRRMQGRHALEGEQENWAVPQDYAALMGALLSDRAAAPGSCAAMLALMQTQANDRRIARHLPREERPRWGSKTGSLPGVVNDVGFVVTGRGPLVIAVFCEGVDPLAGEAIVGDIAWAAYRSVG